MSEPYWYEKHPEGFACLGQGTAGGPPDILHISKEVAIGYTFDRRGNFITHKHGPLSSVEAWAENTRARLVETLGKGHWLFKEMNPRIVSSETWDVADLNWAIQNINGLNRLARERKLDL